MYDRARKKNEVNPSIGKQALTWSMNNAQFIGMAVITIIFIWVSLVFHLHIIPTIFGWAFTFIIYLFWAGKDITLRLEEFLKSKNYISEETPVAFNQAGIPIPVSEFKGPVDGKYVIENNFYLLTYGEIRLDGHKIGYHLLKKGNEIKFLFGWEVQGYEPSLSDEEALTCLDGINMGILSLPFNTALKVYSEVTSGVPSYLEQVRDRLAHSNTWIEQALLISQEKNILELSSSGRLCEKKIYVLAKFKVELGKPIKANPSRLDQAFDSLAPILNGQNFDVDSAPWQNAIQAAYDICWRTLNTSLNAAEAFGLKANPQTSQELFERDWKILHPVESAPTAPQVLVYDQKGLEAIEVDQTSALGVLFGGDRGRSAVPEFGSDTYYCPIHNQFCGWLRISKPQRFPELEGSENLGMMKYIHNAMREVYDYRIVCEIDRINPLAQKGHQERIISSAYKRQQAAIESGTHNPLAEDEMIDAKEARRELERGGLFYVSLAIELRRSSSDQLAADLIALAAKFPSANTTRVEHKVDDYFLQSQPYEYHPFATKPFNRAFEISSEHAAACLPLIQSSRLDTKGVLLIDRDARTPYFIDLIDVVPNSTGIFGFTGAGKTALGSDMFVQSTMEPSPTLLFDFSDDGGLSTYLRIVESLKLSGKNAEYYDVKRKVVNAVEMDDLSKFPRNEYKFRVQNALDDQVALLSTLVLGVTPKEDEVLDVELNLARILRAFHYDPEISNIPPEKIYFEQELINRRRTATCAGFGNPGYEQMPILSDFIRFILGGDGNEGWLNHQIRTNPHGTDESIVRKIVQRLLGMIESSLGVSLNGISDFNIDCDVLVIGLHQSTNATESLVYATMGLNALMKKGRTCKSFRIFIEEGAQVMQLGPAFAKRIGDLPPTIRKMGGNLVFLSQVATPIFNAGQGQKMFGNFTNLFLGYSRETTVAELCAPEIGLRFDLARKYTSEKYKANPAVGESYWLLRRGNRHFEVCHRPSNLQKVMTFSQPDEVQAFERYKQAYSDPSNPSDLRWLNDLSDVADYCWKENIPMSRICAK
jgi:hypothetical protein